MQQHHHLVRSSVAVVAAITLGSIAVGCGSDDASSDGHSDEIAELTTAVDAAMERTGAPGMEVAVSFGDGDEWIEQFGVTDLESEAAVDAGMTWPLRSVTKTFVVDVLLELADEGVISLDDTVGQYVDGDPLIFEPGAAHVYINTNTLLVGMVIEAVTGHDVGTVLQERLFDPLGLDTALYAPDAAAIADSVPTGHQLDAGSGELVAAPLTFGVFGGSGAMAATIDDLLAWGPVLASGELLDDDCEQQRSAARPLDAGPEYDSYGLGLGEVEGWWGHTGDGLGFTALVMHDLDSDTTVAIFTNVSNLADDEHLPTSLFREFSAILEGDQ